MYACISSHLQCSCPNFRPCSAIWRARSSCSLELADEDAEGGPMKKERME